MDFDAFSFLQDALQEELAGQGFAAPKAIDYENGRAVMFATDEVAYALRYDEKSRRFQLCSATLEENGEPGDWRSLSLWLFDGEEGTRGDAESIRDDFLEVVRGPRQAPAVIQQQKRKRGKEEDRNVDPMFFLNRLANLFPELKDELNEERIVYGQVRFVTFIKEKAVPRVQDLALKYPDSEPCAKLCALFDDMYKNGDLDTRSILTHSLLNSMSDEAFASLSQKVGDELKKDLKYTRRLKDRTIKPEKVKKERKKVDVRLDS